MVKGKDDIRTEHVYMYVRLCKSCQAMVPLENSKMSVMASLQ
jgi:hypothetical protein